MNCIRNSNARISLNKAKCIAVVLLVTNICFAQTKDTSSVQLHVIEISSVKSKLFFPIKKTTLFDSLTKSNFATQSLSDLLSTNSTVFIKNYGPGSLSSAAFRGGNASQAPVIWNGFNIQNSMLGQSDFSQLPTFIFDNIGIEYGGSSATWGSGALAGSIHLNNKPVFNKGLTTLITLGLGSFDTRKLNSQLHYSNKKFSTTTKVYYINSKNNFDYKDTVTKRQTHANYIIKGFLQELSMNIAKNQQVNIRAWCNVSDRNLPPVLGDNVSSKSQYDKNLKLTGEWVLQSKIIVPSVRIAYFDDVLNYTDSSAEIFSKNRTKTLITEVDAKYHLDSHNTFFAGLNYSSFKAITTNYSKQHLLEKEAVLIGYNLNLFNNKLNYEIQIRQELSPAYTIPLTGNTGISYQLIKLLKLKANVAKVFRLPTLNDLYWNIGGNPNLKPEEGYAYEGGFDFNWNFNSITLRSEMTYFSKTIQNWIAWVPGSGSNPTAINISEVFSRGTETSSFISYQTKNTNCKIGFKSAYVLSNSTKSVLLNDASVNRQLIYTPRYNYGATLSFGYKNFQCTYYHNYIGYRFTSSDNSTWLNPYQVANLKVSYKYEISNIGVTTLFQVNNLFNEDYKVVAQRPMPLRNYEIGLTLTYYKPKTENQNLFKI